MLGPFATASRRTPIHQVSLPVLSHAACASMSTTTATTTTRDRGDRYCPTEWAQWWWWWWWWWWWRMTLECGCRVSYLTPVNCCEVWASQVTPSTNSSRQTSTTFNLTTVTSTIVAGLRIRFAESVFSPVYLRIHNINAGGSYSCFYGGCTAHCPAQRAHARH